MTKFVQQKTLGLALGSGGWRGQAHIGVIKALTKAGIKINYIAGASAGALIGGAYAASQDIEYIEQAFRTQTTWQNMLKVFSDPILHSGLFKGKKVTQIFQELVGKHQIENLPIPFCAMASDLLSGKSIKIQSGDLAQAVRSSTCVPFVFEPVHDGEHLLIDGGTATPVPATAAKEMGADVVIAVCLYKNIFPIKAKKLGKMHIVIKTIQLMMYNLAKYGMTDANLVLWPELKESLRAAEPFSGFIGDQNSIAAGEKVVQENIEQIKALLS